MCDNHKNTNQNSSPDRRNIDKKNKSAHERDHLQWNRRNFLKSSSLMGLGSMMLGGSAVSAFSPSPLLANLNSVENDRILVLIRLDGGNDGLNTIIPRFNSTYYSLRPNIAVQEADLTSLDVGGVASGYGLNNLMSDLMPMWNDGKMAVVQSVGYEDANLSHFRSSDIWASASDPEEYWDTGWIGRLNDNLYPSYLEAPPVVPPALQIGSTTNLVFRSPNEQMALVINNVTEFYQIASTGQLYDTNGLGDCAPELELAYLRQTANNAFRYSEALREAYNGSSNVASYPADDLLGEELSIIARLIKGNLGTKIYMVTIGGFDTHDNQPGEHPQLITSIAQSVKAFYDDLQATNQDSQVLTMTFSEFGRTIDENGSQGTDHGNGAPLLMFGDGVTGLHGDAPDFSNYDQYYRWYDGTTDFRSVYATVLQDWLCVDPTVVDYVLGEHYNTIPGLVPACTPSLGSNDVAVLLGHNPSKTNIGQIEIKYSIKVRGVVRVQILNLSGNPLRTLFSKFHERGSYTYSFSPAQLGLSSGKYVYKMDTGGKTYSRIINIG